MTDGHLSKCKECTKADVRTNRSKNIDYYREYDKKRRNRQTNEYRARLRLEFPMAYRARTMVRNAIRDHKLFQEPCEICGNPETHAHHDNYLKPLNVRWLCPAHHSQWHHKHGEGANKV
jgi:hypothetical protein